MNAVDIEDPFPLRLLPNEIVRIVCDHLSISDQVTLAKVSRRYRRLIMDDGGRYANASESCIDFQKQVLAIRESDSWFIILNEDLVWNKSRFSNGRSIFLTKNKMRDVRKEKVPDHRKRAFNVKNISTVFCVGYCWNNYVDQFLHKLNRNYQLKPLQNLQIFLPFLWDDLPPSCLYFSVKCEKLEIKCSDDTQMLPKELLPLMLNVTQSLKVDFMLTAQEILQLRLPTIRCSVNIIDAMIITESLRSDDRTLSEVIQEWIFDFKGNDAGQLYTYLSDSFHMRIVIPFGARNFLNPKTQQWFMSGLQGKLMTHPSQILQGVLLIVFCITVTEGIGNGTKAQPGIYRWYTHIWGCGGAMISSKVGITACHCGVKIGDELVIMDRSAQLTDDLDSWRKDQWYSKVKRVKQANPKDCSWEAGNSYPGGYDYALFELEKEVPICEDNRFGPLAVMLPYLTRPELNVSNLMRTGNHTQCLMLGGGEESDESMAQQTRFRSLMMYRADHFEIDSERKGEERVKMWATHTVSGHGDSGSPFVCIYDDVPYVTSVLGGGNDEDFGPDIQKHLEQLEGVAKEMGLWDNIQDGQKKCGEYYKKYGVINDYINKIENCHYPKKPADEPFYETDWYVYPEVSAVDTAGMNRKIEFETENQCKK